MLDEGCSCESIERGYALYLKRLEHFNSLEVFLSTFTLGEFYMQPIKFALLATSLSWLLSMHYAVAQQMYLPPPPPSQSAPLQAPMMAQPMPTGDVAQVIGRQPNYVTTQQRQCEQHEVVVQGGGGGGVLGALAGGLLGSTLGHNSRDRNAGAAVGMVGGALIGNELSKSPPRSEIKEVCRVVPVTVQQGETVTFNYQGRVFTHSF